MKSVIAALVCTLGACASFEDEDVVIDLRILAMSATVPEQVVDVTEEDLEMPAVLLEQLVPSEMCALVADPEERNLRWEMTLCVLDANERCDGPARTVIGGGVTSVDPDTGPRTRPQGEMCATIQPDGNLLGVVLQAFESSSVSSLGGIDYGVALTVGPVDGDPADDLYAGKTLRVSPRIPAERSANVNPLLERFDAALDEAGAVAAPLPLGRCVDQATPLEVAPNARLRIEPIERADTRETYVVPTLDGETRTFTEAPTYQWLASMGGFSSGSTGGPRDIAGNPAELHTFWRAPAGADINGPTLVSFWFVQRDERLGATWYESCVRVVP